MTDLQDPTTALDDIEPDHCPAHEEFSEFCLECVDYKRVAKEEADLREERALAEMATQGVGAGETPGSGPLIPDEELPSKIVFNGTNFDDLDGRDLAIGDVVTCTVVGVVVGTGDEKRKDRVQHIVKVGVQSVEKKSVLKVRKPGRADDA